MQFARRKGIVFKIEQKGVFDFDLQGVIDFAYIMSFLTCPDFSKGKMLDLCKSYPRIIPGIMPPNTSHNPKSRLRPFFFGIVWDCMDPTIVSFMDLTS